MTSKNKAYWKKRADRLFSLFVRQRDAVDGICKCITCDNWHNWRLIHCGHFMSRRHEGTRYHEQNTGCQCVKCNTFNQGEQFKFGIYIDNKYGKGTSERLSVLAKMDCKRTWFDYMQIANEILEDLKTNGYEIR